MMYLGWSWPLVGLFGCLGGSGAVSAEMARIDLRETSCSAFDKMNWQLRHAGTVNSVVPPSARGTI